jgi:hypothetical protein
MKDAIGYLRVSTAEQGRSGLGLAALRYGSGTRNSLEGKSLRNSERVVLWPCHGCKRYWPTVGRHPPSTLRNSGGLDGEFIRVLRPVLSNH